MFKRLSYLAPGYLAQHVKREIKELYASAAIMDFAISSVMIFEPIYLYTRGYSLQKILLFYLGIYFLYFILIPLGAKFSRRFGYEHGILASTPLLILYYLSLFAIPSNVLYFYGAILFSALFKSFYWPGYHADFARFCSDGERGREVSERQTISAVAYVVGPAIGGAIIAIGGFKVLFIIVAILILVSNLPLLSTKEVFTPIPFSYRKAYSRLFRKENLRRLCGYLGFGEELIVLTIWPIFIYVVIKNYLSIGIIIALTTLVTSVIVLYIGHLTDFKNKFRLLKFGSVLTSASAFLRILVGGSLGVFLTDTFSRVAKNFISVPLTAITYERAQKTSVMKTIVFYEMALILGKILACLIVYFLFFILPSSFTAAFIVAGLMSLLYALL